MGYEKTVGRALARGALRSCAVSIVGLVFGLGLVSTTLWVAGGRNASADSYRPLLAVAVPSVLISAMVALGMLFVAVRNRRINRAFADLEVKGHQVSCVTRGWHGTFAGRTLDAWFRKGPTLELYIGCAAATRGGIARTGELALKIARSLTSRRPLEPVPDEVPGCTVYADDPEWMRRLLAEPGVEEALARLLAETERVSPMLSVAPNAVHYMRRFGPLAELTRENLHSWLGDLERLAGAIDGIGPSRSAEQPSQVEEWARIRRGRRFLPWFFGCLLVFMAVGQLSIILLFYFTHYR